MAGFGIFVMVIYDTTFMEQIKVKWNKVSPADLSSTYCAQYFAFSKNNEVFHVNEVENKCLFTKVIQACANYSNSLYDMDIWVGYVTEGMGRFEAYLDSEDMIDLLEWSAKKQLEQYNNAPTPLVLEKELMTCA